MPLDFSALIASSTNTSNPTSLNMSDLKLPEKSYEEFAFPYSYEELPTIYTSSKYIFPVIAFGKNPSQTCFNDTDNDQILTMPLYEASYLLRDWIKIQADSENLNMLQYLTKDKDSYENDLLGSMAPYGYEFEEMFYDKAYQRIHCSERDTVTTAKFMGFKFYEESMYEDEKVISHSRFKMVGSYEKSTNILFTSLVKKSRIQYKFWKGSNSLVKVKGFKGDLCFSDCPLPDEMVEKLDAYIAKSLPHLQYMLSKKPHSFYSIYRKILRNSMWKDLNSPYAAYEISPGSRLYNRIRYHYKKHGTKQARHMIYGTTNKALIKQYELLEPRVLNDILATTKVLKDLHKLSDEKCLHILKESIAIGAYKKQPYGFGTVGSVGAGTRNIYCSTIFRAVYTINTYYKEFTLHKVLNLLKESNLSCYSIRAELQDIVRSLNTLAVFKNDNPEFYANQVLPECNKQLDLHTLSTQLGQMVAQHRDKSAYVTYSHYNKCSEFYDAEDDLYTYSYVKCAAELKDCGNSLNICVGGYGSQVLERRCDIIFVREKSNPTEHFACVEVRETPSGSDKEMSTFSLRQVKLSRNASGRTIPSLNDSVLRWCNAREITTITAYDIETYVVADREPELIQLNMVLNNEEPANGNVVVLDEVPW